MEKMLFINSVAGISLNGHSQLVFEYPGLDEYRVEQFREGTLHFAVKRLSPELLVLMTQIEQFHQPDQWLLTPYRTEGIALPSKPDYLSDEAWKTQKLPVQFSLVPYQESTRLGLFSSEFGQRLFQDALQTRAQPMGLASRALYAAVQSYGGSDGLAAHCDYRETSLYKPLKTTLPPIVFSRKRIERNDTRYYRAQLIERAKAPAPCRIQINGYEDDPRELYEIPQVSRFFRNLDQEFSYWEACDLDEPGLHLLALIILGTENSTPLADGKRAFNEPLYQRIRQFWQSQKSQFKESKYCEVSA